VEIKGTAAIVTGGASGLGLATARALVRAGAAVAILDIGDDRVASAAAGAGCIGLSCDVTDDARVKSALSEARERLGPIRVNVNCAGVPGSMRLVGKDGPVDMERFTQVVRINLLGTVSVMTKCAAMMMAEPPVGADGERGVIINTASITAYEGQIGQGAYVASKGGIVALTLQAAREFAPRGVRVMAIAPGLFRTPIAEAVPEAVREGLLGPGAFPRRFGEPDEFADLVLAVCRNPMLNGETIRLDAAVRLQAG
jgi:NAD(P)-dependent dehydrogenase (short-subunit alcohol dehydrogenase family)